MNFKLALAGSNTALVSEATKIPPHVVQRIADGQEPTPEELELLEAFFHGEYSICSTSSQWVRKSMKNKTVLKLPMPGPVVPGPKRETEYDPDQSTPEDCFQAGPAPTGDGGLDEGMTGTAQRIRR